MSELNTRQWALYQLLRANPDRAIPQYRIAELLPQHYRYNPYIDGTFHDSGARRLMTDDILKINNSEIIQKIIISTGNGIKLASKAEFEKYIHAEFAAIFRKLERTRKKAAKAWNDGQIRLTFGNERAILQAYADALTAEEVIAKIKEI